MIAAAVLLFSRGGFNGVTTRDIAHIAHVSEGNLFRYFRSKRELFIAAIDHELGRLQVRVRLLDRSPGTPVAGAGPRAAKAVAVGNSLQAIPYSALVSASEKRRAGSGLRCGEFRPGRFGRGRIKGCAALVVPTDHRNGGAGAGPGEATALQRAGVRRRDGAAVPQASGFASGRLSQEFRTVVAGLWLAQPERAGDGAVLRGHRSAIADVSAVSGAELPLHRWRAPGRVCRTLVPRVEADAS